MYGDISKFCREKVYVMLDKVLLLEFGGVRV